MAEIKARTKMVTSRIVREISRVREAITRAQVRARVAEEVVEEVDEAVDVEASKAIVVCADSSKHPLAAPTPNVNLNTRQVPTGPAIKVVSSRCSSNLKNSDNHNGYNLIKVRSVAVEMIEDIEVEVKAVVLQENVDSVSIAANSSKVPAHLDMEEHHRKSNSMINKIRDLKLCLKSLINPVITLLRARVFWLNAKICMLLRMLDGT